MTNAQVLDHVRRFVTDHYLYRFPDVTLTDDLNLLEAGVIDSLGVIELVGEVEGHFAVTVRDIDVTEENFGSVTGVVDFVTRQRTNGAS
jgi:acyl carrier protein